MAQLQVTLVEGRNFKAQDTFSENDAYLQIYLDDKKQKQILIIQYGINHFNHLRGQNQLHIDVYDEDSVKDEQIGSIRIHLTDLYHKGSIDNWYHISAKHPLTSPEQIHLALHYEQLYISINLFLSPNYFSIDLLINKLISYSENH